MNVFKCLPRFGASPVVWHQSVRHNLHSTGLENNLGNSTGKKSTQNYFMNTSLARWWAPESFHAMSEDRAPRGEADWSWNTVALPPSLGHAPPYSCPPAPPPTPERHPLSSWATVYQAWPCHWPDSCCLTSSICTFPSGSSESTVTDDFPPCSHRFFACSSLLAPVWCSPASPGPFHLLGVHTHPVVVAYQDCHSWCYSGTLCVLPPGPLLSLFRHSAKCCSTHLCSPQWVRKYWYAYSFLDQDSCWCFNTLDSYLRLRIWSGEKAACIHQPPFSVCWGTSMRRRFAASEGGRIGWGFKNKLED